MSKVILMIIFAALSNSVMAETAKTGSDQGAQAETATAHSAQGAQAETEKSHYQLDVDHDGNVWRLDTLTGQMTHCLKGTPPAIAPTCYPADMKPVPFKNAKGWKLNIDQDGNKSYVSPDRSHYEVIK